MTAKHAARLFVILTCISLALPAFAHQQPTTLAVLNASSGRVDLNLHLPLSELQLAFGHQVTTQPIAEWSAPLRQYLIHHIVPISPDKRLWSVQPLEMTLTRSEQIQSGPFQEVNVHLVLIPPPNGDLRHFQLRYDVIMHQVVTHKALFSTGRDSSIGIVHVDTGTSKIAPLNVDLTSPSLWPGFLGTVRLGMQHIREGLDHLLFLATLLLPALLTARNGRWENTGNTQQGLIRLAKIVSAFTLGHSITLITAALNWVRLPQRPVEILIAFSILVTAIHAIRPIFPGSEALIAAGFGLVHGLAFASAIADLQLPAFPLALSIFGFNLGIELMQLLVIALTIPWLIILSRTSAYRWVQLSGAVLAAIAATGWMLNRISGQPNIVETSTAAATALAPVAILLLAFIAIPAYCISAPTLEGKLSQ